MQSGDRSRSALFLSKQDLSSAQGVDPHAVRTHQQIGDPSGLDADWLIHSGCAHPHRVVRRDVLRLLFGPIGRC
jgi:hypothetical protein